MSGSIGLTNMNDFEENLVDGESLYSDTHTISKKNELTILANTKDRLETKLEVLRDDISEMNKIKIQRERTIIDEIKKLSKIKKTLTKEIEKYYEAVKVLRGEKIEIEKDIINFSEIEINSLEKIVSGTLTNIDTQAEVLAAKAKRLRVLERNLSKKEMELLEKEDDLVELTDSIASKRASLDKAERYIKDQSLELDKREREVGEIIFNNRLEIKNQERLIKKNNSKLDSKKKEFEQLVSDANKIRSELKLKEHRLTAKEELLSNKESSLNAREIDLRVREDNVKRTARLLRKQNGR